MKKLILIAALALPLGGCNVQTVVNWLAEAQYYITAGLSGARQVIESGCSILVKEGATPQQEVCISKLRAGVRAVCVNTSKLTDDVAGNYIGAVRNAVKNAQSC